MKDVKHPSFKVRIRNAIDMAFQGMAEDMPEIFDEDISTAVELVLDADRVRTLGMDKEAADLLYRLPRERQLEIVEAELSHLYF